MEVIPAIDIRGGRCVRLEQGDYDREKVFDGDPLAVAHRWAAEGATRIHVVDLDGAREGRPVNLELIVRISQSVHAEVQMGGGVRDMETLRTLLEAGLSRVVLGTAAVTDQRFLREAVAVARERLVVSVDAREGLVSIEGWTQATGVDARAMIDRLAAAGVQRIVYTDILRDGVRAGPNFEMYERLTSNTSIAVIAAGGIATTQDVQRLAECGVEGAIIGRALYEGSIRLREAVAAAR
ncbi:MAG: 1-(5-phosphoribosyl)-5-[(5-phosphoribosylamino)methylideneamino]imidazole-4-carboxamide isomerase [Chloroflexi bacterium]|nr:1-(5-phosphoribosyl)-5-[(5-phosphoribosylamino)methylideneamino]imidazole-4-carboxamide isomerase [Chloroflexota bacterium]